MPYIILYSTDSTFMGTFMFEIDVTENYSGLMDAFFPVIYVSCVTGFAAPTMAITTYYVGDPL